MCLEGNTSLVSTIHLCQGRWVARTCVSSGFQDGLTHLLTSTISYGCTFFHIYFASPSCDIKIQLKTSVPSSSIGRQAISQRQTVSGTPEEALLLTYFFYHLSLLSTHMRNYVVYFIWHVCVCSERKGLNLCLFLQFVYVITRNLDYIWPHQSTNRLTQKDLRFLSWATEGGGVCGTHVWEKYASKQHLDEVAHSGPQPWKQYSPMRKYLETWHFTLESKRSDKRDCRRKASSFPLAAAIRWAYKYTQQLWSKKQSGVMCFLLRVCAAQDSLPHPVR